MLIKISLVIENISVNDPKLYEYDLDHILQKEYCFLPEGLTCPTCKKSPCKCRFFPKIV